MPPRQVRNRETRADGARHREHLGARRSHAQRVAEKGCGHRDHHDRHDGKMTERLRPDPERNRTGQRECRGREHDGTVGVGPVGALYRGERPHRRHQGRSHVIDGPAGHDGCAHAHRIAQRVRHAPHRGAEVEQVACAKRRARRRWR